MLGSAKNQDPHASANLMAKAEYNSIQSCAFNTYNRYWMQSPGDGNYFTVPSLVQSGKNLDYRDLQLHLDKVTFSSISSDKLQTETRNVDQRREHRRNPSEENSHKNGNFSSIVTRKRRASAMHDSSDSTSRIGESNELMIKSELIKEDQDRVGNVDEDQEIYTNSSTDDSIPIIGNLIPEDVVKIMGQRLYQQARRTMVDQQRIFSVQIFELHRLIKVQRLISQSPQSFHKKKINEKPSIVPFPPMPKLLYKPPQDQSPIVAKPKVNPPKSNPRPKENLALPLSIPSTYIPSLIFHPPPVNQWLVPIRSPSEGLVYKPIAGPCFPNTGFMGPTFGDNVPMSLSTLGGTACGVNLELDNDTPSRTLSRVPSQHSAVICDGSGQVESNLDGPEMENERVRVIKVVPHSRKFALASAARIFQAIQEERKKGHE